MSGKLIFADDVIRHTVLAGDIKNPYMEVVPAYFLREAPAVDAVEVVRCGDCRFYVPARMWELGGSCYHDDGKCGYVGGDCFCSDGERREESDL